MTNRLYVIPASHPATTAQLMLAFKGIEYKRTDLMPVVAKGALRAVGFPRTTVPALKLDGERIQGSREIARALDRIQPDPPLFPADPHCSTRSTPTSPTARSAAPSATPPTSRSPPRSASPSPSTTSSP